MNPDCEICRIISDPQSDVTVFATENWRVVLTPDQGYLGRAWVTAQQHVGSISELSNGQWLDLHMVMSRYEKLCKETFGAELFNWACLMNDAYKEENPTPHVHWHVRPRYKLTPVMDGQEYLDPNFAHHYDRGAVRNVNKATLVKVRKKLLGDTQ